ncbi:GNAT family N-acetyltransferase [Phenylobacterium sp. J367]|uniref:GNAT family N-acetyltransferase n=1 Tax=Phenylobacterium sp. J367 TaxID=2898435 RepID=UPI002150BFB0|nr:GNAT family protein [Phenylobacterium sp. J367]MCR5877861.1 GNAT family N-acetyltransferase [Phenylobacterium sp. J367]
MNLESRVLESRFVRLEPFTETHEAGLRAACAADPDTWNRLYPYSMLGEAFDPQWARLRAEQARGVTIPFAVVVGGAVRGMTTFIAVDPANNTVEIGATYYEPSLRGGPVNPSAKRLLLGHAFDAGAARVQFRVDALNARSRAAVLKLGAVQEGILRRDRVTWTGRVRDTVVFSILVDEWPAVRDGLDARLAGFA